MLSFHRFHIFITGKIIRQIFNIMERVLKADKPQVQIFNVLVSNTKKLTGYGHSLAGFDKAVAGAKSLAGRLGIEKLARSTLR